MILAMEGVGSLFLMLLCCMQHSSAVKNPGLEIRVTDKGLEYAGNVSIESLTKKIQVGKIPDQHWKGPFHIYDFSVTRINVSDFTAPVSNIVLRPDERYTWKLTGLGFSLEAKFAYSFFKFKFGQCGGFQFAVEDSSMDIQVRIGRNRTGQPTLVTSGCSYSISNYSIKFTGKGGPLYDWLADIFKGFFQRVFQDLFCRIATSSINRNARNSLSKWPVTLNIGKLFAVDYKLLVPPTFTSTYVSMPVTGEVFWKKKRTRTTLQVPELPPFNDTNKMVYFLVTDFPIDTLGNVAMNQGILRKTITEKDLPADQKYFLNTTCPRKLCLGGLILQTSVLFPNSKAELQMKSSQDPKMTVTSAGVSVNFGANIQFYVRHPDGTRTYMFAIKTKLDSTLQVSVERGRLLAEIDQTSLSVGLVDTQIGAINPQSLRQVVNKIVVAYVIPQLNKLGAGGFPLPPMGKHLTYNNTQIILAKDTIIVGTDVEYQAHLSSEMQVESNSMNDDLKMEFQVIGSETRPNHRKFGRM